MLDKITNPEAKRFAETFLRNRKINKDFYEKVPEDKLDFRMVNTPKRKSDTPRESLIHQIYVTRNYIYAVKEGKQEWSDARYKKLIPEEVKSYSKSQLLEGLQKTEQELVDILSSSEIGEKKVKVSYTETPIPAIASLWGLNDHEILHTGWNLALMDHFGMERFSSLRGMWG